MQILRAADRKAQPWKNGGGVTREIAVHPPSAGMDDFEWRISAATVAAPGPFSRFDGIERVLLVTEGRGMILSFGDGRAVTLTPDSAPLRFPGDVAVDADLVEGEITDLNIMTRRGTWTAEVERRRLGGEPATFRAAGTLLIVLFGQAKTARGETLGPGDTVVLSAGETLALTGAGQIAAIDLRSAV